MSLAMLTSPGSERPGNKLLRALQPETLRAVRPMLLNVAIHRREILHDYDTPIEFVYFPENSVGSIVGALADGSAVETATVGDEGLLGLPLFFGSDRMASQAFCQVSGDAWRMTAADFKSMIAMPGVQPLLFRYTQAVLTQIAQGAVCNRAHATTQRCARWLLQTHDRVHRNEFTLNEEFLAQMLGVRRATVTDVSSTLQDAGAIRYREGQISIVDRAILERLSCECYAIVAREHMRLVDLASLPSLLHNVQMSEAGQTTLSPLQKDASDQ